MADIKCEEIIVLEEKNKKVGDINEKSSSWALFVVALSCVAPFLFLNSIRLTLILGSIAFIWYYIVERKQKQRKKLIVDVRRLVKQIENKEYGLVNLLESSPENFDTINKNLPLDEKKKLNAVYESIKNNKIYEQEDISDYIDLLKYMHHLLNINNKGAGVFRETMTDIESLVGGNIEELKIKIKKMGLMEVFERRTDNSKK